MGGGEKKSNEDLLFLRQIGVAGMVRQACNFDFSVGGERKDKNVENQTRGNRRSRGYWEDP